VNLREDTRRLVDSAVAAFLAEDPRRVRLFAGDVQPPGADAAPADDRDTRG